MLATVGRGIGYLWHLEWCVVQGILQQSYHLIQLLTRHLPLRQLAVVPVSLGKIVLWGVEQAAYIVVPSLHTVLWRIPKQLFLLDIQVDLKILSAVTVHLRVVSHALLQVLWEVFQRVSNVVLVGLRYYHETSFTTLHVASVLQTILLGMALRQDMRDLMLAEEEEARRRRQFRLDNVENMLNQAKESLLHRHVAEPLTSNRFVRRLNGIRLFIQAHRKTSMQYIIHHFIGFVSLLGLWVLPLSGKLYYFVLLYVVPYYSTKDFLSFFFHTTDSNGTPLPPPLAYTLVVFILRAVLTTIFQHTISALLYRILRELFIFIVLLIVLVVVQWAWPRRKEIQEKVTEVIAATPAKIRSSLSSPQTSATRRADMRTPQEEETPITAPLEYEEEKEKEEATPQDVSRALNDNNNEKEEEETAEEKQQVEDDKEETHASPELAPPLFSEETEPPTLAEEPPQEEEENETPADNEKKDDTEKEEAAEEAASETVEHNDASNNNTESENKPDE
ncbi:hypothetical protein AGDE_16423 [Angomonas deanei]|nr:hypothetical protein AGDE_16423 [Angomonas deanei]|eukprot:EPY17099.1 hypothetical protein AGDE_16423 [Angomonas deanei]